MKNDFVVKSYVTLPGIYTCIKNCFQLIMDFIKIRKTQNNPALMASSSPVVMTLHFCIIFQKMLLVHFNGVSRSNFPFSDETNTFRWWKLYLQEGYRPMSFFKKPCVNIIFKCNCILYSSLPRVRDEGSCRPLSPYIFFWISTNSSAQVFL